MYVRYPFLLKILDENTVGNIVRKVMFNNKNYVLTCKHITVYIHKDLKV